MTNELKAWKLDACKSISLWTEDGAANNIKSSKLLGVKYEVCSPHNVQRAILFGVGARSREAKSEPNVQIVRRPPEQAVSFFQPLRPG
eukprot:7063922-Prymnesium_polylepis.1